MDKISVADVASRITEHWRPKSIAELNGQEVKLAKFQGEFVWHHHRDADELFLGVAGTFRLEFRDHTVTLGPGDVIVVPRGFEHRTVADEEATVLIFEPSGVKNTGNVDHPTLTAPDHHLRQGGLQVAGQPEVWLRGPIPGVSVGLQPVAHALLWALEDLERLVAPLSMDELWARPGGVASIGFHVRHMTGALERLFSYARGEPLSEGQKAALLREKDESLGEGAAALLAGARTAVAAALEQLRRTDPATLDEVREVGRAKLPSTVRGLLSHGAEHAVRHAGQIATTAKIVRGTA